MGYFRHNRFPMWPSYYKKLKTVRGGEWWLDKIPTDGGVSFMAKNNDHSEWLWTVKRHSWLFNFVFGSFMSRITRANDKYQNWINGKNAAYFLNKEVCSVTQE